MTDRPPITLEPRDGDAAPLYVVEAEGVRYRVHDATYGLTPWKWTRYPLGDPRARTRVFAPDDKAMMLRTYTFGAGEDRAVERALLARQLREAAWAPRDHPVSPAHNGR